MLALIFIIGTVIGRGLPVGHLASRSATFAVPPQGVWDVINDPAFMRTRGVGDVKTETVESVPPRRLVRRIVGESSFGGTWTYMVGHHRTIDSYLAALRRRLDARGG